MAIKKKAAPKKAAPKKAAGKPKAEAKGDSKKLTQTQIVKELANICGVTTKVAKTMVESYADLAVRETKRVGVFVMPGLGRLVRQERKARTGRNPATGASIKIPAKKVVKFRVAKTAQEAIVPGGKKK